MSSGWKSNTTLADIAAWLGLQRKVTVLTHSKPDGDAVGSSLALVRTLREAARRDGVSGEGIVAWFTGPMPTWFEELAEPGEWGHTDQGPPAGGQDAVVVCDTGSWAQIDALGDFVKARRSRTVVIDHHLDGAPEMGDRLWVERDAAAAAVPVGELCRLLLGKSSCATLPKEIAEPLLLGCATDTGWFRFSNTNARLLRMAADLHEAGADQSRLYELTEQRQRAARMYAIGRALSGMRLFHRNQLAVASVTLKDIGETEAAPGDTGGFADMMLSVAGVRVAAILTEVEPEPDAVVKMSVRSKPGPGAIDANELVKAFGGGGHARAAGAKVKMHLEQATAALVDAAAKVLA